MTPYYDHGGITIYHGDCREIAPTLGTDFAVVSDPPYGISFDTDYRRFTSGGTLHAPVAGDTEAFDPTPWMGYRGGAVLWGANCYPERLRIGSWLVWDKRFKNGAAFLADAEVAWMSKGHGVYLYAETSQGFVRSESVEHPTQKPVGLMRWCIAKVGGDGTILDPFMGSGTTLRAAKDLGRKAIGIELEERYCEIAARRLEQEVLDLNGGTA